MKLALITNYWIHSDGGGIREYTKNLVWHLEQKGVDVVVLFRRGIDTANYKLPSSKIKFFLEAKKILKKEKPDAILSQGGWFTGLPATSYKKKNKNAKILYLFHTHFDSRLPLHKRMINDHTLNRFDRVGFVSKALKENVRNVAGLNIRSKKYTLYAGVEVKHPSESEIDKFKRRFNIESKNLYLLGLGLTAIYAKKEGAKLLMRALSHVIKIHPNLKLILTREGKYSNELQKYAGELQLDNWVIFTGDIKDPCVAIVVADIYTHISYEEGGVSLSILENMIAGKPIIASKVGGIPEAIIDDYNGILVNNEVGIIKEAIIKLIENKEFRENLGRNAKKTANDRFNWEKTANQLIKIYRSNE